MHRVQGLCYAKHTIYGPTPIKQNFFYCFLYKQVSRNFFLHFQTPFSKHLPTHQLTSLRSPGTNRATKVRPLFLRHPHRSILQTTRDQLSVVTSRVFRENKTTKHFCTCAFWPLDVMSVQSILGTEPSP